MIEIINGRASMCIQGRTVFIAGAMQMLTYSRHCGSERKLVPLLRRLDAIFQ